MTLLMKELRGPQPREYNTSGTDSSKSSGTVVFSEDEDEPDGSYEDTIPNCSYDSKSSKEITFRCHLYPDPNGVHGNGDYVNFIPNEEFLTFEISGDKGMHVISFANEQQKTIVLFLFATQTSEDFTAASSDSSKDASAQNSLSENENSNFSSQSNSSNSVDDRTVSPFVNTVPNTSPIGEIIKVLLPSSLPVQSQDSNGISSGTIACSADQDSLLNPVSKKNADMKFIDDPETPCCEKISFPGSQSSSFYVNRSHSANQLQYAAEFTNVRETSGSSVKDSCRRLTLKPNPPCGKCTVTIALIKRSFCDAQSCEANGVSAGEEGFYDLGCSCPPVRHRSNVPSDVSDLSASSFLQEHRASYPQGGDDTSELSDSSIVASLSIPTTLL
ncbi:tubby-related protein 4 [Caerostris extrusa]|uniref:Tubby-related protein 4 n=1 Tax=Caerostris extrusa TaxID=172846 RepID=A0AAV4PYZ9_CAEEX|nr:tubby-related protein 4 [Caerostris extrusa]